MSECSGRQRQERQSSGENGVFCVCVYVCVCVHACVRVCMCMRTCMRACVCVHVFENLPVKEGGRELVRCTLSQ